jgi:hypothetical protein
VVQARLDQLQHCIRREVIDLRKDTERQRQPDDFVHKGVSRLAATYTLDGNVLTVCWAADDCRPAGVVGGIGLTVVKYRRK